jgi:transcriptional regulator with XRE-family HTH domain
MDIVNIKLSIVERIVLIMGRGRGKTPELVVELLKEAVARKSQYAVAKETGLGLAVINRYLRGIGEPTAKTMEILADYFGKPVSVLRGEGFVPKALIADGEYFFNKVQWPESTGVYEKHLWLLTHEFLSALDDTSTYGSNPLLIRTTYLKALNVLEWDHDFYDNIDKNSVVFIKIKEHVAAVFESLQPDISYILNASLDIQTYFKIFAQGVIKQYLAILEKRDFNLIKDFSILFKSDFTKEETEIYNKKSAEIKLISARKSPRIRTKKTQEH